ncbi:putative glycosyl hydrolase family 5 member [Phytophthora sojae]|uniref:glucan 1,3-beta-glucosidase n=1 Tax=Phytophthora sojae (strain P6497) TaxID=1094619 RepID=G5A062_PHYSP|nr:putative glycosyl hydrolase family 5 member [Phytophthora sojae]EGZ11305.1 putative glycosyl hydrolase family 5 member [Phytophthora sojae]|eukprot:XP_009534050.1 putative glycosyl hydrolase family 5 member [Phytophthora sojae]
MLRRLACLTAALAALTVNPTAATDFNTLGSDYNAVAQVQATDDVSHDTTQQQQSTTGSATQTTHIQYSIRNGDVSSIGVNLGSWLVAEHWMTSAADFWQGVSDEDAGKGEYTAITKASDPDTIRSNLDYHHSTFITEKDIAEIAAAGLNTVRVPVGYWIVGFDNDDPSGQAAWAQYSNGTLKYLDALVTNWANKHNIAVLFSLHAAKGSQNGADHSSPCDPGNSHWSAYDENVANTVSLATFLADRYKDEDAFLGIGLLNEPNASTDEDKLYAYYEKAYAAIRTLSDCVLSVAPLLYKQSPDVMTDFMQAPAYTNVWVEWHPYFVWGYESTSEYDLTNTAVKTNFQNSVSQWNARENHNRLFIGEWSFATAGKFGDDQEGYYEFCKAMVDVMYQAGGGFTFWSWRLYGDESGFNAWSLRSVLRDTRLKSIFFPNAAQS